MSGSGLGEDFRLPPGYITRHERQRIARLCTHPECLTRVFGNPVWECEKHLGKTETQPNHPYFGEPT